MTIFTIGYEGLDIRAFLSLLAVNGVETVVDVREYPLSRKPGFSKKALAVNLDGAGLEYLHMPALGCPKPVREQYRLDGDWSRYTVGFIAHLDTQRTAIAELSALVALSRCALLCFEADYSRCHRSMVALAVQAYCGAAVQHISAKTGIPVAQQLVLV